MKRILDERRLVRDTPQTREICIILGEQQLGFHRIFLTIRTVIGGLAVRSDRRGRWEAVQVSLSELVVGDGYPVVCSGRQIRPWRGRDIPRPAIGEPQLRDDMQIGGIRTTIICGDANINVVRTIFIFCVLAKEILSSFTLAGKRHTHFDENVPVTIFVEGIGVKNLKLDNLTTAVLVFAHEIFVWICLLWILVQKFHVRVGRRRI
jgi:hypothetical protein